MMNARQPSGLLCCVLTATLAALLPASAPAQTYPSKPIRVVVPYAPGGGTDLVARFLSQKLTAALGQPVIIDNRAGASGNIGTEIAAKAPADGYTLLAVSNTFTTNPSLYKKIPYDPVKDFEPVSSLTSYMLFLTVHPSLPVRSVKALIALAKAKPNHLTYASAGSGSTTHIAAELLSYMTGARMTHIPYKGSGPSLPPVIAGQVALTFGAPAVVPFIKSGKLILLGVTGAKRSPIFPQAQTIAEAGLPGYEASGWNALFAPAGTPLAIVRQLNEETAKGLRQSDVLQSFEAQGLDLAVGTPEELATRVKTEVAKWAKVIKAAGIRPE